MQGSGSNLQSFDPITANNNNNNFRPGSANTSFSDGLDVDGTNTWFSPDVGPIYNNGSLVVSTGGVCYMIEIIKNTPKCPESVLGFFITKI
jgi:hypothetical protein